MFVSATSTATAERLTSWFSLDVAFVNCARSIACCNPMAEVRNAAQSGKRGAAKDRPSHPPRTRLIVWDIESSNGQYESMLRNVGKWLQKAARGQGWDAAAFYFDEQQQRLEPVTDARLDRGPQHEEDEEEKQTRPRVTQKQSMQSSKTVDEVECVWYKPWTWPVWARVQAPPNHSVSTTDASKCECESEHQPLNARLESEALNSSHELTMTAPQTHNMDSPAPAVSATLSQASADIHFLILFSTARKDEGDLDCYIDQWERSLADRLPAEPASQMLLRVLTLVVTGEDPYNYAPKSEKVEEDVESLWREGHVKRLDMVVALMLQQHGHDVSNHDVNWARWQSIVDMYKLREREQPNETDASAAAAALRANPSA